MKKIIVIALALATVFSASAQDKKTTIKAGDLSIGVNINPMTAFAERSWQPKDGDFAGAFVTGVGETPKQMYILSKDPVASFKLRYHLSPTMAVRAQLGITGSKIDYREYVTDDYAVKLDPDSQNKVADRATSNLNAGSLTLALEFTKGEGALKFNGALGLMYAIAGGSMDFEYGNKLALDNLAPSTMPSVAYTVDSKLNDGKKDANLLVITYARPLKRFNTGYTNAVGLVVDMGIEWFFAGRMSLGAAVTFTPIMVMFQPQTYTTYEAYTSYYLNGGTSMGSLFEYNKLVSPGSTGLLYGTDNFGFRISLNYYL